MRSIICSYKKNQNPISKEKLVRILESHPETIDFVSYTKYTLLKLCKDKDIITIDRKDNLRFPIERNETGEITKYHYIS